MQGYADNDLEFEETSGQYSGMVHHNINAVVHSKEHILYRKLIYLRL